MVTKKGSRSKRELSSNKKCLDIDDYYSCLTPSPDTEFYIVSLHFIILSIIKGNSSSGLSLAILYHRKGLF